MEKSKIICRILILLMVILSTKVYAIDEINEKSSVLEDGQYILQSAININKVVTVKNESTQDGANIELYEDNNLKSQRFEITQLDDGYYKIVALHSGKVLDVYAALKESGANVDQYTWNGTDAQKWKIQDEGNGCYSFASKCNGLYLDVYAALGKDGTNVQVYESNNGIAQKFYLKKYEQIQPERTIAEGKYVISSAINSNKVVSVSASYKQNLANIQINTNDNLKKQQFNINYLNDGYYKIESVVSGKVLDVYAAGKTSGTNVDQYEWNGSDAQKWIIKDEGNGYYSIISKCNELYLDIYAGLTAEGNNIQVYRGNGSKSQLFKFEEVTNVIPEKTIEDGIYNIKTAIDVNRYIDIENFDNFSNARIWSNLNSEKQQFYVKYLEDGYYKITAIHSEKALDVYAAEVKNGANVEQYEWNGSDAQKWIIKSTNDGYYKIISKCNELNLDVTNGVNSNGTNVQMYENTGSESQKFSFIKTSEIKDFLVDGVYSIRSGISGTMNLDVLGKEKSNGANVGIWRANETAQQKFEVTYLKDGYYKIKATHSGKVLDVYAAGKTSGTNVDQYEWNGTDAQKWYINSVENGYYTIVSKCNGLYLDVYGGISENGNNVQVYSGNNTKSQMFKFETGYFGIDVSKHQKEIDFDKLEKNNNINFMIARAGYYSESKRQFIIDEQFERNYIECKNRGIPVGTYIYSYAISVEEVRREAYGLVNYLNSIGAKNFELPVFFDIEDSSQSNLSKQEITDISIEFCEIIKNAGYNTGIYTSKNWLTNKIDINKLTSDYTIWVASYGKNDGYLPDVAFQYTGKHDIWQYSSTGIVSGISTNVDMNLSYIDWKNK